MANLNQTNISRTVTEKAKNRPLFMQWNVNGLRGNYPSLLVLMSSFQPVCVSLQELRMYGKPAPCPNGYSMIRSTLPNGEEAALLIKEPFAYKKLNIRTTLQIAAARVNLDRPYTICSIYIPPREKVTKQQLEEIFDQLPTPFIVMGDFN